MAAITDKTRLPFTYTGTWDAYDYDNGKKFYARFLTSGTLKPAKDITIDVFLVGGGGKGGSGSHGTGGGAGGGGGGGGRTTNRYGLAYSANTSIAVTVGAAAGTTSFAGSYTVAAGSAGSSSTGSVYGAAGGAGGSGGGGGGASNVSGNGVGASGGSGGSNGNNGSSGNAVGSSPYAGGSGGSGQGSTTRPFGGSISPFSSMSFATGGTGGSGSMSASSGSSGSSNTGNGGGGSGSASVGADGSGGTGGTGIVIIRGVLNTPPEITGEDTDLGDLTTTGLTYAYTVTDEDTETVGVTEALDGKVLRTYTATGGEENTLRLTGDDWTCILNGSHTLAITATADADEATVRTLTFSKDAKVMEFITKATKAVESRPVLLALNITGAVPGGAAEEYYACNNGLDDTPTWEDITSVYKNGYSYSFQNTEKTANSWAVRFRVKVNRANLEGDCYASGMSFAYKTDDSIAAAMYTADLAEMLVDQEYRMTLLELGVI